MLSFEVNLCYRKQIWPNCSKKKKKKSGVQSPVPKALRNSEDGEKKKTTEREKLKK